jgi:hypothetical protein
MSGIPTASIKLIGADPDYYCLPFQEFGIRQVTSSEDLISWLLSDAKELNLLLAKQHEGAIDLITASMLNQLSQKP